MSSASSFGVAAVLPQALVGDVVIVFLPVMSMAV